MKKVYVVHTYCLEIGAICSTKKKARAWIKENYYKDERYLCSISEYKVD